MIPNLLKHVFSAITNDNTCPTPTDGSTPATDANMVLIADHLYTKNNIQGSASIGAIRESFCGDEGQTLPGSRIPIYNNVKEAIGTLVLRGK